MNTTPRLSAVIVASVVLAVLFAVSAPAVNADNAQTLTGTWVIWFPVGLDAHVPAIHTYLADGTVIATDTFSQGGLPGVPIRSTPVHGVWKRTGPATFAISHLFLVYDAASSLLIGFGRSRGTVALSVPDASEASGTVALEFLGCPSPVSCPDPQAADSTWMPFPGFPPGVPVTATRLRLVE